MFIDSVLLYGLVKELRETILFSQVRQIHQTDARVMDIELYRPAASPIHLIIHAQNPPFLYTATQSKKQSQYIASQNFCMTLRKNLEGSRLSDIEQVQMDRIVKLSFDRIETEGRIVTKCLYAELIPSAPNLILTEDGRILDVLVKGRKLHRELSLQKEYTLPDGSDRLDFMQFSKQEMEDILRFGKTKEESVKDFLFSYFNGLSTPLLQRSEKESGISADTSMSALTEEEIANLAGSLVGIGSEIREASGLYVYKKNNKEKVSLLPLAGEEGTHLPSIAAWLAQSAAGSGSMISVSIQELRKHIHSLIKKEERKEKKISAELSETEQLEKYKLWGNLLSIYAYMNAPGQKEITVDNPFDEAGGKESIPIDPEFSIIRNSQNYFKKYGKMKTRLAIGQEKLDECRMKLEYLKNADYFAGTIKDRQELTRLREELKDSGIDRYMKQEKKKKQPRKDNGDMPERHIVDGYTVWIGKNSRQNEFLTLHKAEKTDLWLHAQKIPGSHVVIEGSPIPAPVIARAAAYAAFCSKGRDSGKVAVDYTLIRNVKKIKNGPMGLVNYTHQKTVVVEPMDPQKEELGVRS